ncbi:MAG: hypothetical protein ABL897_11530 [Hyphomicrobium sp.]
MGRAPVASGAYITAEGGYQFIDRADAIGHGISSTGLIEGPTTDTAIGAHGGWGAGASIGFASSGPIVTGLPFTRAEIYVSFFEADDTQSDTVADPAKTTLKSVDGSALGVIGVTATSEMQRRASESGVRFAFDQDAGPDTSLTLVVTPFLRNAREDTDTVAIGTVDTAWRSANVETWQYGITVAIEPEVRISSTVALVGRIGGGIYGYSADASFASRSTAPVPDPFLATLADSDTGVGFRGVFGAGIKLTLAPGMQLTGYAEADYLSNTGRAILPDNQFTSATTSTLGSDDGWEFRAGARVSLALGSGQ